MLPRFCEYVVKKLRSSACSRQDTTNFSPYIHRTWETYFSPPLCFCGFPWLGRGLYLDGLCKVLSYSNNLHNSCSANSPITHLNFGAPPSRSQCRCRLVGISQKSRWVLETATTTANMQRSSWRTRTPPAGTARTRRAKGLPN